MAPPPDRRRAPGADKPPRHHPWDRDGGESDPPGRAFPSRGDGGGRGQQGASAHARLQACERTKSSLSTSRHRSSSRKTGRWSRRTAHEPPQAKARRGSNNTFALTAFHSVRTRDQNVGRGGTYQRKPVATPTVESARGWTS